ncbi:MAG: glutamine synthetase [Clostridiaceae bacterium]|nr:glutamine synthetase [Clostridiaceae bacterium]MCI9482938.1 glutamine synthetase [Clostridiaceae bacterium]
MSDTMQEVLRFIEENDVKFIRLAFCDIFGIQKNISIMPGELPRAFSSGICFDASAFRGFMHIEQSDLLLLPDPATLSILPWRPSQGRVVRFFCDIRYPDGQPFEGDGRHILREAEARAKSHGLTCKIGTESEFYLFELDEKGEPTLSPHDHAGYFDVAPLDKGENVRRQICLTLEEMGIQPESSHHEQGPGQNEIDFKYSDALEAADNLVTFKWVVRTMAAGSGLFASFLPKPLPGASGSGLHINLSLFQNGRNMFRTREEHSQTCESFIAGILERAGELTVFLNPLTNSYRRFGKFEAPKYITWSHQNRSPLVRIPSATGELSRMELRSPDAGANPYLAVALLIHAGMDGIDRALALPEPCNENLFSARAEITGRYAALPGSLRDAVELANGSAFLREHLPARTFTSYLTAKAEEWERYQAAGDKEQIERDLYFAHY